MAESLREVASTPEGQLLLVASWVVSLCVTVVLAAVVANFLQAGASGAVKQQRKSPVATGTMLLFTFAFYEVIHRRAGVLPIESFPVLVGLTVVGLALVVGGTVVNVLGRLGLGRNWANQVTLYEEQTLVQTGVFGWVRHPLYASLIWMFLGASLIYHNTAAFLANALLFVPAMVYRARQEERLLAQQFPEYAAYRDRVGMFFPRLKGGSPHDRV